MRTAVLAVCLVVAGASGAHAANSSANSVQPSHPALGATTEMMNGPRCHHLFFKRNCWANESWNAPRIDKQHNNKNAGSNSPS